MITSERQLASTQARVQALRSHLLEPGNIEANDPVARLSAAEIERLIDLLETEIREFQLTRSKPVEQIAIQSPADLLLAPIRYRIASGMTVEEFAREVGVAQRQIARYEALGYQNCSIPTFQKIINKLNIRLSGRIDAA